MNHWVLSVSYQEKRDTSISRIKYSRLLEIFSQSISDLRSEESDVSAYHLLILHPSLFNQFQSKLTLDDLLSRWTFVAINKKRSRLLLRVHLALLREALNSQQADNALNYVTLSEAKQSDQDPNALLTASSVRMSLAMVKTLGPSMPDLYRVVAEAQMDLFRRSSDLALSNVEVGSLQAETVRAIMEYAEEMTVNRKGGRNTNCNWLVVCNSYSCEQMTGLKRWP